MEGNADDLCRAQGSSPPHPSQGPGSRALGGDLPEAPPGSSLPLGGEGAGGSGQALLVSCSGLLDERSPHPFRRLFGEFLRRSQGLDTAVLRARLGPVDLTAKELEGIRRMRVLVAEVSSGTLEDEAYGLAMDHSRRAHLERLLELLAQGRLHIRSAPLGGWSPDFSVFWRNDAPFALLLGLHWFQRPFPHRGPAWACWFGAREARAAAGRFEEIWEAAHEIGPAVGRILQRAASRQTGLTGPWGRDTFSFSSSLFRRSSAGRADGC